jgi:hypothetical protein
MTRTQRGRGHGVTAAWSCEQPSHESGPAMKAAES